MSDVMDFGFDEAKMIKNQGLDRFKLNNPGECSRISLISFRKFHDVLASSKAKERGSALSEDEKAELFKSVDAKLAEKLAKPVDQLTEADRLDIKAPRFSVANTHYKDGIGTIRCLSKYQGSKVIDREVCCKEIGDPDQSVATLVMRYPTDRSGNPDMELIQMRKMIEIYVMRLTAKKFKTIESVYANARANNMHVIDLSVTLDGDPKYQKWQISNGLTAIWAREDANPELRTWLLEEGLRNYKHVSNELGYEMKKEILIQKLRGETQNSSYQGNSKPMTSGTNYANLLE